MGGLAVSIRAEPRFTKDLDDETRPQDLADLRQLLLVADESERTLAREAVQLIEARGFSAVKILAL